MIDKIPLVGYVNNKLKGQPDYYLTLFLLALSVFGALMALFAPPIIKAGIIAYWIVP